MQADEQALAERIRAIETEPHRPDEAMAECPRCGQIRWLRDGHPCGYCEDAGNDETRSSAPGGT